ncbi:hypothetical protein ACFOY2_05025 [Nonomuraea purpurea]|uniref:Uncharacterized protein n=1 Tax=Nonomuraea purpurea TaxID=1849276 RepID=A0ABV8FXU3_9ACTN
MTDERYVEGEIAARQHCRDVADILVSHLRASDHPQAETWAEALNWFRQKIKGGHLSIYAQREFDQRFGAVDWSAFPAAGAADAEPVEQGEVSR